ncbi:VCBS repeat-containing protein [Clostridium fermenticellae]|uniref:VCBS repeat-containing protein n=1 Tax=Clostridium fermenticellae TaxID=2068654 RepID=A0A386H2F0_9CLOT|nr:VCBS repeat-containing protein [Clostridium fermenticellae]AYD39723.1 VCBS repeat-containing protein [Clostridium fermenticellae]
MKLRILFLRKKYIYIFLIIFILLIFLLVLFIKNDSTQTFNDVSQTKTIKSDFDGDGYKDNLNLKKNSNKYYLDISTKNKTYNLTSNFSKSISDVCNYWPVHITFMDISRDKIPEIFVQGSVKDKPVQYVFSWIDSKFENVFSNSSNILGFIDCKNNKTPKVISGKFSNNTIYTYNYIFLNYKFKNYNYENSQTFMGKDSICGFINLIQTLPQSKDYIPKDIFSANIINKEFDLLSNMSSQNNTYTFQDAVFEETKCTDKGDPSEILWKLNFRGISNEDKTSKKNYTINITLVPDQNSTEKYYFKISSMSLI